MMAKMFYTLDEAKAALGKNEEEIKQLAREGRLREFRDGPRLMFKADQVESLKAEMGGGGGGSRDQVDLGVSDTGAPIGLVDTGRGNTGSGISLVDSDVGRGPTGSVGGLKDDTALAADLGLSGSMGGVPSPGRPGSTASGLAGSRAGVNVLGESEYNADPARRPRSTHPFRIKSTSKASARVRVCSTSLAKATTPASARNCSTKLRPADHGADRPSAEKEPPLGELPAAVQSAPRRSPHVVEPGPSFKLKRPIHSPTHWRGLPWCGTDGAALGRRTILGGPRHEATAS